MLNLVRTSSSNRSASNPSAMDAAFKMSAFEGSAGAMMTVDRDFKILHVNDATRKLLQDNEAAFRSIWPSFSANAIVGACIDIFHKNPDHQRQLLSNPDRLPYKTDISVGDLKIALHVTAVFDNQRRYIGNVLQWDDVTTARMNAGMLAALDRSQAIIEFSLDGTIQNANTNFLTTIGYALQDIKGRHHRMFMDPAESATREYAAFWDALRHGEYKSGEYKRIGAGGKTIWTQASYNPILDANGRPMKVVKFAADITKTVEARLRNERLAVDIQQDIAAIVANVSAVSQQTTEVSVASSETSDTIHSVAAAAEELSASINEISSSVHASKASTGRALDLTRSADSQTAVLQKTAEQMSGIVDLIDDIASQINLLALNATIESARAGEAGRGFAVVASEVKQLAAQVTSATKTISAEIHGVQTVSADVIASLRAIQNSVNEVTNSVSSVAAAVEQQSAATSEISHTMQTASVSIGSINRLVGNIATSMDETRTSATRAADQVRTNIQAMVA